MSNTQASGVIGHEVEPSGAASARIDVGLRGLLARMEEVLAKQGHLAATVAAFDVSQLQSLNDAVASFVERIEGASTRDHEYDETVGRLSARMDVLDSTVGELTAQLARASEAPPRDRVADSESAKSDEIRGLLELVARRRTDRRLTGLLGWAASIGFGSVLDLGGGATFESVLEAMEDARGSLGDEELNNGGSY